MLRKVATRIEGIRGVYSVHLPGQPSPEGVGVYHYILNEEGGWWSCEAHGLWRPWLPGQGVPCEHLQLALALQAKETP